MERFGRIDSLVNNAGVYISKPFTDYTADDYETVVGVNLTGFFTLTQRAIVEMLKPGSGPHRQHHHNPGRLRQYERTLCLDIAHQGRFIASATKSLAIEYASRGIRVNAVSPGIIQTPVHPVESYAGLGSQLPPVGHVGQVADVVDGILFLESSPFITGEVLHIDGGQDCRPLTAIPLMPTRQSRTEGRPAFSSSPRRWPIPPGARPRRRLLSRVAADHGRPLAAFTSADEGFPSDQVGCDPFQFIGRFDFQHEGS